MTHAKGFVIRPPQPEWGTPKDTGLHLVMVEPEIAGNTGNVGRLCAGTNMWLHLVKPFAFELDNKRLRRAGLDYWPHVKLCVHESFEAVEAIFGPKKLHLFTARASRFYTDVSWSPGDVLVFGCETRGLSQAIHERYGEEQKIKIPKRDAVRSLNLSNAVAIASYEALRQLSWGPLGGQ